jgi:glutathione synthase/RimK-type ligase-like ATP-grasp enzyme
MPNRIGLLVGEDHAFVEAIEQRCARHPDIECELALISRTGERHISHYDVLIDRLSPLVPHYGAYLRAAALAGVTVLNDPFAVAADDGFFGISLAAHLGMAVPRTILLPQHSHDSAINTSTCLRNVEYPVNWHGMTGYVRMPCVLRSASRPERVGPVVVRDLEQLWRAFDRTGQNVTMLQQHIDEATHVRAVCVGAEQVVLRGIDGEPPPLDEPHHQLRGSVRIDATGLSSSTCEQLESHARTLCGAVGYDLASVDFAVRAGVPYVVSAPQPVPELAPETVSEEGFDQLVEPLAALAVSCARGRPRPGSRYRWARAVDQARSSR